MLQQMLPNVPFVSSPDTAPAFWLFDTLWLMLAEGEQTGGSFSLVEQRMRKGIKVPAHVHNYNDEWFYIFEGTLELTIAGKPVHGKAGDYVWIARGNDHAFEVTSECHVLNGYTPGGPEQPVKYLGQATEIRQLPPESFPKPDERAMRLLFNHFWSCEVGAGWEHSNADPRG